MPRKLVSENPPGWCHRCNEDVEADHWFWQKGSRYRLGGTWRCIEIKRNDGARAYQRAVGDPVKREKKIRWQDERYADEYNKLYIRFSAYASIDRRLGRKTIARNDGMSLMREPCYYCTRSNAGGLDRIENDLGHDTNNVRPCCMYCNRILGDLPSAAKELLREGLQKIYIEGALGEWIPPQHRKLLAEQKKRIEGRES